MMRRRFGQSRRLVALSVRAYRVLLLAYPPDFRREFGSEMARAFRDSCREALACRGPLALVPLWLRTLGDLAGSAAGEWYGAPAISQRRMHLTLRWRKRRRPIMPRHGFDPVRALRQLLRDFQQNPHYHVLPASATYAPGRPPERPDRFAGFTKRTQLVLSLSQQEAQQRHHTHIGPEHLLLGLLREGNGLAAQALRELDVDLDAARERIEYIIGHGDHEAPPGEVGLTPRAKRVIELAVDEARSLNHHYVGTEHLLLGLIREGDNIAAGVLTRQGVKLEEVRATVLRLLGG